MASHRGDTSVDPTTASKGVWRPLLGFLALGIGLYLVVRLTAAAIYRAEGISLEDEDCDDCGVTALLDNLGWLRAAVALYALLAGLLLWFASGRARRHAD